MIGYTTFAFFIFCFGITFLLYFAVPQKFKWIVLLAGSYIFYFISCKGHIVPIIAACITVWIAGIILQRLSDICKKRRSAASDRSEKHVIKKKFTLYKRIILALGVITVLSILLICKYSNFFTDIHNSLSEEKADYIKVIQPLGISFYSLSAISYMTDVYHQKIKAEKNPFRLSLFLCFMLTVVEGPVTRYDSLGAQLKNPMKFDAHRLVYGCVRVVWGLIKKVVIADRAAMFANCIFDNPDKWDVLTVLPAVLMYTLQLYAEFSGIMDIMCGLGETLGIILPENFKRPFFAKTINEFWQRWHITLGSWLRDYVFYPASLSKGFMKLAKASGKKFNSYYSNLIPTAAALFFVWFSNGFWHGAGWKYIVYGLYYYFLMMLGMFFEPLFRKICPALKIDRKSNRFAVFQRFRTFVIVITGMMIFRAKDLKNFFNMFAAQFSKTSLLHFEGLKCVQTMKLNVGLDGIDYIIIILGAALIIAVGIISEKGINIREQMSKLKYYQKFILFMVMIFTVILFGAYGEGYGVIDLIYAKF